MKGPLPEWNDDPKDSPNYGKHYAISYHEFQADVYYLPNLPTLAVNFRPGATVNPIIAVITTKLYKGAIGVQTVRLDRSTPCDVLMQNVGDLESVKLYAS